MNLLLPAIRSIPCMVCLASCASAPPIEMAPPVPDPPVQKPTGVANKTPQEDSGGMAFAIVHRDSDKTDACRLDRAVAALGVGCERLSAMEVSGAKPPAATQAAFDGDGCTLWNSGGFAPQSASMDLGAPV